MRSLSYLAEVQPSVNILGELLKKHMLLMINWRVGPTGCTFRVGDLTVRVDNSNSGMSVTATSDTIPRKRLDPLRVALRQIMETTFSEPPCSMMDVGVMLLQMGEEALSHVQALPNYRCQNQKLDRTGWDVTSGDWRSVLSNPFGVNLLTVKDTAKFLLGKSITEILVDLPPQLRVLHIEPVFRNDLVAKFTRRREEMRQHLSTLSFANLRKFVHKHQLRQQGRTQYQSIQDMADLLSTPKVTFHGAPRNVMQSIVRHGFVVPGQKIGGTGKAGRIACGASFGIGIYSSPSIQYASVYATSSSGSYGEWRNPADMPGMRIVVCATLMGRPLQVTRDATRRTEGLYSDQADSHVSPNMMEYVVFEPEKIIPCYVIHLDYGAEQARRHFDKLSGKMNPWKEINLKPKIDERTQDAAEETPGAKQAKKEALNAAASKWFPYGFGGATGTNFVIEEIGDVSDDEEDYGDFQELRGQQENAWDNHANENGSWFDEFQTVRKTNKK